MKEKPKDLENTVFEAEWDKTYPRHRAEMKAKFNAGAVPLASDFVALIDLLYDAAKGGGVAGITDEE